jgi:hypothetical protein
MINSYADLDHEMLKVMKVTTHYEEGYEWRTLKVKRYSTGYNSSTSFETNELTTHWKPSTKIHDAMDIVDALKDRYSIQMTYSSYDRLWHVRFGAECGFSAAELPEAICRTVLKIIEIKRLV